MGCSIKDIDPYPDWPRHLEYTGRFKMVNKCWPLPGFGKGQMYGSLSAGWVGLEPEIVLVFTNPNSVVQDIPNSVVQDNIENRKYEI